MEILVHSVVLFMVAIDLFSHYQHHRRNKKAREAQRLYTLQEAFEVMSEGYAELQRKEGLKWH